MNRDLSQVDYVYLRVDGIHLGIGLDEGKLCLLVMIGVRADGRKELVALADGYREPAQSWTDLLRDCARRGMRAPVLAIGDGALGFWKPTCEAKVTGDEEELLAFCDHPTGTGCTCARPTRVEPAFATVRVRTKVTKGHGSKAAGLAMAFKLIESAQRRGWSTRRTWSRSSGPERSSSTASSPGAPARTPRPGPPEVHRRPAMTPWPRDRLHGQRHEATKLEDPCGRCSRS
jgi:hypothetical protein